MKTKLKFCNFVSKGESEFKKFLTICSNSLRMPLWNIKDMWRKYLNLNFENFNILLCITMCSVMTYDKIF